MTHARGDHLDLQLPRLGILELDVHRFVSATRFQDRCSACFHNHFQAPLAFDLRLWHPTHLAGPK